MTPNSRTTISQEQCCYVNSAPLLNDWGQPPASHYIFETQGVILHGYPISGPYIQTQPCDDISVLGIDKSLKEEFDAWELASDQDLLDLGL
jgi:hypothetical protein